MFIPHIKGAVLMLEMNYAIYQHTGMLLIGKIVKRGLGACCQIVIEKI